MQGSENTYPFGSYFSPAKMPEQGIHKRDRSLANLKMDSDYMATQAESIDQDLNQMQTLNRVMSAN